MKTMLITIIPKILIVMQIIGSCYMFYLAYQVYKMDTSNLQKHKKTVNAMMALLFSLCCHNVMDVGKLS